MIEGFKKLSGQQKRKEGQIAIRPNGRIALPLEIAQASKADVFFNENTQELAIRPIDTGDFTITAGVLSIKKLLKSLNVKICKTQFIEYSLKEGYIIIPIKELIGG